ncbi:MAG: hypothetical protein IKZ19_00560 [Clostridia bacterium]|nr:hypothetical protein [Clostridia bacterium]
METERIAALAAEGKYSFLAFDLVKRISREECAKYKKEKDRVKAVKKRLHILCGAFENDNCHKLAAEILDEIPRGEPMGEERLKRICLLHASTRERLPVMAEFYGFLGEALGSPRRVLDIGCGFAPFCAELLPSAEEYHASDIDERSMGLISRWFSARGLAGSAAALDAVSRTPDTEGDAAFIFKLYPVLEAQKKGRGFELMEELKVEKYAVSFPIRSLGGRDKGMEAFYGEMFEGGLPGCFEITQKKVIGTELVYAVTRK